ncbi:athila retroelement ORF1 protein [Trifolium pratense]|uniref:Athila retroelement ORF1 protein n=1 Tax=Trifolium pratense TaxID=57577 RepID=A0A2K3NDL0_TRIPR|nr:athila retroelement ORF1 protein [Trifolium pratense]
MQESGAKVVDYDPEPERTLRQRLKAIRQRQALAEPPRRLLENQFDGRANRDPWDHLTQYSETCRIQKVPDQITEDQKKLRLFAFSLTGMEKELLQCLPSETIQTWKEMKDKFLERLLTHNQF